MIINYVSHNLSNSSFICVFRIYLYVPIPLTNFWCVCRKDKKTWKSFNKEVYCEEFSCFNAFCKKQQNSVAKTKSKQILSSLNFSIKFFFEKEQRFLFELISLGECTKNSGSKSIFDLRKQFKRFRNSFKSLRNMILS